MHVSDLSLRRLWIPLAAAALAVLALIPPAAGAAPVAAKPADSFVDSIGVNTHTYYTDTPYYTQFGTIKQRLRELGVRHIRENLVTGREDQYERLNELAAQGQRATLILGSPEAPAELETLVDIVAEELPGTVAAVEGPNEWDLNGPSDWMSGLAAYQARLYSTVRSRPSLAPIPIVGPALGNTNSDGSDISGWLDYGNIHSYPNAEEPEQNLSRMLGMATEMSAAKPVMATETGYHTALGYAGDHRPASEAAQAVYLPRLFLEYYRRGVVRTFSYELLDEFSDPARSEAESNFGLLRHDLSPKPAFSSLRNLIAILADPGPAFAPGQLDYAVGGDVEGLRHMLLQKRDGSYYLALWRDERVWDKDSLSPLPVEHDPVTLSFAQSIRSVEKFAPNVSAAPISSLPAGREVSLQVGPEVVILRLGAKTKALGEIKVWVSKRAVEPGEPVRVSGRMKGTGGTRTAVKIQRWKNGWKTVGRSRTRANGSFRKLVRFSASRPGNSRIRVVARRAKPSNQVRVRVLTRDGGPAADLAAARRLTSASSR